MLATRLHRLHSTSGGEPPPRSLPAYRWHGSEGEGAEGQQPVVNPSFTDPSWSAVPDPYAQVPTMRRWPDVFDGFPGVARLVRG